MSDTNRNLPSREQIQQRAYERYLERGSQSGDPFADWLAAEQELVAEADASESVNVDGKPAPASSPDGQQPGCTNMLVNFYGLREQPFGVTPDPAYLYASKTHTDALASLSEGISDTRGFLALIAEPGMGKTTLLYQMLEQLQDSARAVLIFQSECTSREFIEYILHDLGVDVTGMGLVAMHGKLNEILFEELMKGKRFVLVVDEAQNLADSVLETVRMLSNFETHNAKLLQIVLAGQPALAAKLAQPRLSQLRQRLSVLCHLQPFSPEETRLYIEHRLTVAGSAGDSIFEPAAIRLIARHSKGIPRNINNLCYNSMLRSYQRGRRIVTPEIVQEVIAGLDIESLISHSSESVESAASPLAAASAAPAQAAAAAAPAVSTASAAAVSPAPAPHAAAPPAAAKAPVPRLGGSPVPVRKDPHVNSSLTYGAGRKLSLMKWSGRSAAGIAVLLAGTLLLTFLLGRAESRQQRKLGILDPSSSDLGDILPAAHAEGAAVYDATPQDTGNGQVLTVAAGPQQSLKDLSLRYAGRFDSDLARQIVSLNPGLKDLDHLEEGQLIRIPLPPGAMKQVNDTAESVPDAKPDTSSGLFARLTALLHDRK
jgi:type II secretory pathway predicted ATPase ExeA